MCLSIVHVSQSTNEFPCNHHSLFSDTGDDFFSGYNLPNSTLKVDGVQGSVVCNTASSNVTDCAAVCIKNKDKRIYVFLCLNAEHTCYFDLIPGMYICGVVPYDPSGVLLESNGTIKEVEAKG